MRFEKVAILGVGLIGASFALALKKKGLAGHISGYGRSEKNLVRAGEKGIIDTYSLDPSEAARGADLVVLATPVGSFVELVTRIRASLKPGAIVMDVGSVKGKLVRRLEGLMPDGVSFLGCHPIAGGESSGIEKARADLFEGALCIIAKTDRSDARTAELVAETWRAVGSDVRQMTPDEHDRVFGLVSHLPHLVAYALVNTVGALDAGAVAFSGRGFIDATRIALSSPELWRDVCLENRENLLNAIDVFKKNLEQMEKCLKEGDAESLKEEFAKARGLREKVGNRA